MKDKICGDCWGSGWETQFITPCKKCNGTGEIQTLSKIIPNIPEEIIDYKHMVPFDLRGKSER